MSIRTERVASLIKEEIGAILIREYNDPSLGLTTVTEVRVSPDLRIARVFFSIFGAPGVREKTMRFLETERSHMRGLVGSRLRLRFVPDLEFRLDTTLDRVDRINALLKEIHKAKPEGDDGDSGGSATG
jgi:ribosome-binding factor A